MYRTGPVYVWVVFYLGFYGFEDISQFLLGLYQVNDGKETVTVRISLEYGRTLLVKSVRMRMISFLSSPSSSRTRLFASTTSVGSIKTVLPVALSSCTIPLILRFRVGMTGITSLPSRRVGVTSFLRCLHFVPSAIYYIRYVICCPLSLPVLCESEEVQGCVISYLAEFVKYLVDALESVVEK